VANNNDNLLPDVGYRVDSGLAILSLNRSADGNRLDPVMLASLETRLSDAIANPVVRAIVLRSEAQAGEPFCHGMNLDVLAGTLESDAEPGDSHKIVSPEDAVNAYGRILELLSFGPKPTISLVRGSVKAGGVGIVAACDIIIASDKATFELTEVFFGLVPANVWPYLVAYRMSPSRAKFFTLLALPLDADNAYREKLVDLRCAPEAEEASLKAICKQLFRAEPGAVASAKAFIRTALDKPGEAFREQAKTVLAKRMASSAVAESMDSLRNGESPAWFARFKPELPVW